MSPCHRFWFSNLYIFETQCHKPLIFQTYIIWSNISHSLKCQWFTILDSKDLRLENLSLWQKINSFGFIVYNFENWLVSTVGSQQELIAAFYSKILRQETIKELSELNTFKPRKTQYLLLFCKDKIFQGYQCELYIVIFTCCVTWNNAYSPFNALPSNRLCPASWARPRVPSWWRRVRSTSISFYLII